MLRTQYDRLSQQQLFFLLYFSAIVGTILLIGIKDILPLFSI